MSQAKHPIMSDLMPFLDGRERPEFRPIWKDEFLITSYDSNAIRAISCIGTFLYMYIFLSGVFFGYDGAGGGSIWVYLTWMPNPICSLTFLLIFVLFSLDATRNFCMKNYNALCSIAIIVAYSAVVSTYLLLEIRRALYQNKEYDHIIWGANFTSSFPVRTCNDTNPVLTVRTNINNNLLIGRGHSLGCNNLIISGGIYSFYAFLNMFPMVFHMSPASAFGLTFVNSIILLSSLLAVGTKGGVVVFAILFQFLCGMLAGFFCHARTRFEQQQFAVAKATAVAAEQNSNLLYTLIPRNVVEKLSSHEPNELLGTAISHCTVMFCTLEPQSEIQSSFSAPTFDLLNDMFAAFDRAVLRFGMFKYQHVGDWYIVACPRAALPFDGDEQAQPYPHRYTLAMVRLGQELRRIASGYTIHGSTPLWLKVGLNCGPVAGAVIGTHRSFYCLYGDVVNTAARMCKYAGMRHVHCSGEFATALARVLDDAAVVNGRPGAGEIHVESRGFREVKGKGRIETFDVIVDDIMSPDACSPRSMTSVDSYAVKDRAAASLFGREARCKVYSEEGAAAHVTTSDKLLPARVDDPAYRISWTRVTFVDEEQERIFLSDTASERRKGLLAGIALHVTIVVCHMYMVVVPEYPYDYSLLGDAQLAKGQNDAELVLSVHLAVTCAASAGLAAAAQRDPLPATVCEWGLVSVKLLHVICSAVCHAVYPVDIGWMLMFSVDMSFLQAIAGLRFAPAATLVSGTFIALVVSVGLLKGFMVFVVAKAIAYAVCSVALAYIGERSHRLQWQWNHCLQDELGRLSSKLCDLLPPLIASRLLAASTTRPRNEDGMDVRSRRGFSVEVPRVVSVVPSQRVCEMCKAAVLQLDICEFTSISQTLQPMALAGIVHALFSVFDRAVEDRGLFKMDTIGDAYIVAGFLSTDAGSAAAAFSQSATGSGKFCAGRRGSAAMRCVCEEVLDVGGIMLRAFDDYRKNTGFDIHCRIGVSAGQVVAGVLGHLQPRFHIFGEGIRAAEHQEQTGCVDTVHASPSFVAALRTSAAEGRGRSRSLSANLTPAFGDSLLTVVAAARRLSDAGLEQECQPGAPSQAVSKPQLNASLVSEVVTRPESQDDDVNGSVKDPLLPTTEPSKVETDTSRSNSLRNGLWLPVGWLCEPNPDNSCSLVLDPALCKSFTTISATANDAPALAVAGVHLSTV